MCLNANIIDPSNIIILGKRLNFCLAKNCRDSNKKNCMNELKKANHILELLRPSNNH
ncbi:hypothetical protein L208DRAFT_1405859 [Tricholoma matsutake]|nr:hypothetical protein L208DRAFT_1405859 [Tricholoma matsutake 945]